MNVYEFLKFLSASDKEALEAFRPLAHAHIVITGKLDEDVLRQTLEDALVSWGAVIEDRVTRSTDVLLAVDPYRATVKRSTARTWGIPVKDEREFVAWLVGKREHALVARAALATGAAPVPPPEWFTGDEEFEDTIAPLSDFGA